MSRRSGALEAGNSLGSAVDNRRRQKRLLWIFLAVAGGITVVWLVLNLPRVEDQEGENTLFTTKRAGWPDHFARWSIAKDTRETIYSSFSTGVLLFDLVTLAIPIVVAWVIVRHLGQTSDQVEARHQVTRGPSPSHRPHGSSSTGGWG